MLRLILNRFHPVAQLTPLLMKASFQELLVVP